MNAKDKEMRLKFKKMADDMRKAESWCDLDGVLNRIKTMQNLYEMGYRKQEWISVEERLPDNHRTVLVACKGMTIAGAAPIAVGSYGDGHWFLADAEGTLYLTKYMHIVVTHWMPLPEPPKMKED